VRLRAWDGSTAGPVDAPLVVLNSVDAVRRLLWRPGELGAAQAYVTGELDVPGDLDHALTHAFSVAKERGLSGGRPTVSAVLGAVRTVRGTGVLGRPPAAPTSQARLRGRLHSRLRDRSEAPGGIASRPRLLVAPPPNVGEPITRPAPRRADDIPGCALVPGPSLPACNGMAADRWCGPVD